MIGILGGSFDPVHVGHLRLAVEAREALQLDHVRLIPLNQPNADKSPVAPPALRLQMLQVATAGEPGLQVDDRELRRGGISYTVDTLLSLREELSNQPICLILGMDAVRGLNRWHQWPRLLNLAHLLVAARPGVAATDPDVIPAPFIDARTDDPERLRQQPAGLVYRQTISALDISSTTLRARRRAGRSIRYLVPDAVHALILQHQLYLTAE